jgi:hypothetical protein
MRWQEAPTDPHDDAGRLVGELLPAAKLLLERYGEILPMGALIGPDGELEQVPCSEGIDETNVLAQAELLRQAFVRRAEMGELRASALIYEPAPSGNERTTGTLMIEIEHFTGYNVTMAVPFRISAHALNFLAPVIGDGRHRVFARRINLAASKSLASRYA